MHEPNNKSERTLPPVCLLAKISSIWLLAIPLIVLGIFLNNLFLIATAQLTFFASAFIGLTTLIYIPIARLFGRRQGGAIFAVIAIMISALCQALFLPAVLRANKPDEKPVSLNKIDTLITLPETSSSIFAMKVTQDIEQDWPDFSADYLQLLLFDEAYEVIATHQFKAAYSRFRIDAIDLDNDSIPEFVSTARDARGTGQGSHTLTILRLQDRILTPAITTPCVIPYGPNVSARYNIKYADSDKNGTTDVIMTIELDPADGSHFNSPTIIPQEKIKIISWTNNKSLSINMLR